MALTPLRFEPIFQYRLWGGRKLEGYARGPLGVEGPVGEAWILSDREDFASVVAEGPMKGTSLGTLLKEHNEAMLGGAKGGYEKFSPAAEVPRREGGALGAGASFGRA